MIHRLFPTAPIGFVNYYNTCFNVDEKDQVSSLEDICIRSIMTYKHTLKENKKRFGAFFVLHLIMVNYSFESDTNST